MVAETDIAISGFSFKSLRVSVVFPAPEGDDKTTIRPRREAFISDNTDELTIGLFYLLRFRRSIFRHFITLLLCSLTVFANTCPPVPSATKNK